MYGVKRTSTLIHLTYFNGLVLGIFIHLILYICICIFILQIYVISGSHDLVGKNGK